MAAPLRCMTFCRLSSNFLRKNSRASLTGVSKCSTETDVNPEKTRMDREMKEEYEREVERLRDVSNMSKAMKARHHGIFPKEMLGANKYNSSRKYYRKAYATYGKASGLDPSKIWPSKEEMLSLIDDDKNWEPTFQEMVAKIQAEKDQKEKEAIERDIKIDKAMGNMDKLIQDYKKRMEKVTQEEKKTSALNIKLLNEFRDKYGYSVPEKSFRFKEFKKEKFEEEKKQKKMEKKAEQKRKEMEGS